jgi:hypothetical protein
MFSLSKTAMLLPEIFTSALPVNFIVPSPTTWTKLPLLTTCTLSRTIKELFDVLMVAPGVASNDPCADDRITQQISRRVIKIFFIIRLYL